MLHLLDVTPSSAPSYPVLYGSGDDREPKGPSHIAAGLARVWQASWRQVALIGDDTTMRLFGKPAREGLEALGAKVLTLQFAPGEASKSRQTKARLEDAMLSAQIDRASCVVALGGGIVLDLAGFVAATYMRGIAHVNIATTLLAQVDASIGGKTAINTAHGKNLIGAFHQPRAVLLDGAALSQLPDAELRNGLAEAIKHALIADERLFLALENWAAKADDLRPPMDLVARAVKIKADVVAQDPLEQGMRHILNCGHTVAHAIEGATAHEVAHGEAVAIGMVVEARLAAQNGSFPEADLERLCSLLHQLGLPSQPPCDFASARAFFGRDKKTAHGQASMVVRCAIPDSIGTSSPNAEGQWARAVDLAALERAWSDA